MATRNITDIFLLMRDNAAQNRQLVSDHGRSSDRMSLVDVERGGASSSHHGNSSSLSMAASRLPPDWVDSVEGVHYEISRIREKLKDLQTLHTKCLNKPSVLDESTDDERRIQVAVSELNQMFHHCERLVNDIRRKTSESSMQEHRIATNVVHALATTLTELTSTFRREESSYLKRLRTREERSRTFFPDTLSSGGGGSRGNNMLLDEVGGDSEWAAAGGLHMSDQLLQDNTEFVEQREQGIIQVVHSIGELRDIFKDLSGIIVEQGTILDRIDYNVEQTCVRVDSGYRQLQKAEKYQKTSKKMYIIAMLFIVTLLLIIILIATRT